ncbi:MAG: cytochrome c3 family protein [Thermodesulfobacteriota bacterium]|nr:cytochrome c3 family protein [Thermodesulfobacteriota bacterium]
MRKGFFVLIGIILVLVTAIVAYHRFQYETKTVFFSLFPIFKWKSMDQPILFNHLIHKEKLNLNCTFCHRYVERHRSAGIPNIDLCRACHATDAISKRPEALKVVKYVQAGREIPWERMYELPKFVVFPHWIHVQSGVDCSVCHGLTGKKERPVKMVDRNYMAGCMDCHKKKKANIDCYACHSS